MFLLFNACFFTLLFFCAFVALAQWRLTKDAAIPWYIFYLVCTFAHYGKEFWLKAVQAGIFFPLPDLPLQWDTQLSYAAFAGYFFFIVRIMDLRVSAPRLSRTLTGVARVFVFSIGVHLLLQILVGYTRAEKAHQVFQMILLPTMIWALVQLRRHARFFYQKLILIGTLALLIGFLCVLAIRRLPEGHYELIGDAISCFHTRWGNFCLYHLKAGVAIDVICFSWALTLRQKGLLLSARPFPVPPALPVVNDAFLIQVEDFLRLHFQEEALHVDQVAQAVFLSAGQTNRKLKEKTGLTTEQFILLYRLERARELILGTEMPVGQIALAVGLKNAAHFSRVFKKQYGHNPSTIRQQNR